jgi:Fic family protein
MPHPLLVIVPLQIPASEYEELLRLVARRRHGASVKDLLSMPEIDHPKRTLQRRLDHLVSEGRLEPVGEGRARRYVARHVPAEPEGLRLRQDAPEYRVSHEWLSREGRETRSLIQRPLAERMPVGYQGTFLDSYRPNETFYLPESLRRELEDLGQVGLSELPAGTYLRQVMDRLLIDLSWNSSRLEGNTYSLLETQRLLQLGENAEGKAFHETQMILNHKAAIDMLGDEAVALEFNRYTICNLHALLADNLLPDPGACGRVRSRPVGISGTVFHPLEVPQQIDERFELILTKAAAVRDPLEQAFFVMVHLPYLQPFEDVNKRVSRLAANIPLIRRNMCPLSFVDVDQQDYIGGLIAVYELNRIEYLRDVFAWAYRRSCARYSAVRQSLGDPDPFRLRHRSVIASFVREVVTGGMDKKAAAKWIAREAGTAVDFPDRGKFIEVVETELSCLHIGNIARYRLRPSEFEAWAATWK